MDNVLICGAGIAGTSLAHWLARAGHAVTVVERAPGLRDGGYKVFSVPHHLGLDRWELTYVGPGRTALIYSTAGQTDAKAMFLFSATEPRPADPRAFVKQATRARAGRSRGSYVLAGELSTGDSASAYAAYQRKMRPFVELNQKLGPANIKRMVLGTRGQVRTAMTMLAVLDRLPGKDRLMAKVIAPIQRAATAITLDRYQ